MQPRIDASTSRREFIQAGAAAAVIAAAPLARGLEPAASKDKLAAGPLPTRKLGRSGVAVSVLNQGCAMRLTQRLLDHSYECGVRYFDTADCYGRGQSEREVAKWFERTGKRKDIFLVTKCHPTDGPKQMLDMVDERLKALKTDYIDLFFMHELCDGEYPEGAVEWPKSPELKETAEKLKKSGKVKLVGFSCHADVRARALENAAAGGFVDAIMFKYDPRTTKNDAMNAAIDKCHKAGIGLIAMKTQQSSKAFKERWEKLKTDDISIQQAVVKAVLSDERLTGMTSHMENIKIIDENTAAARSLTLASSDRDLLRTLYAAGPHHAMCERCGGECAAAVGRPNALHDVARSVMYYERYGDRDAARELYARLPASRVDLTADELARASTACADGLDYAAIFARARRYFA
ncbi:MAG: aldo/keto reductase [Phycisphaerae bacterium]